MEDAYLDGTPLPRCFRCGDAVLADEPICHRGYIWVDTHVNGPKWRFEEPTICAHPRCVFDYEELAGLKPRPQSRDW